ncbi:putative parvulin-type peptidyl-prolyl cis-trans isomerase [Paraburkholderia caffeinitolerans]|uniref:peptidylprolyl isomerase n=2 Tax=Paraburkholderia caffeinitolerans TaxID=1723730 RepID=A0A6J5GAM0_9BURK|nr:putative parvulin-type peptidyl-prolyl cis-trans isomerase [Paraburkholderia caffeinitolerans]
MSRMSPLFRTLRKSAFVLVALSVALPRLVQAQPLPADVVTTPAPPPALSLAPASTPATAPAPASTSPGVPAGAIAVVNGVAIPQSAMDSAVSTAVSRGNDVDTPQLRAALKQQLIIREVVRQQAARAHYDQRPEVQQASDAEKVDVEIQSWLQDNVHAQEPTERQIRARYNNVNAELGKYEYKPQYIVLADQAVAKGVIAQAKAGKPFDALARKFSIVPSKENGGEMPWVSFKTPVVEGKTRGVPVEVARALAKLPVGGVVQQPLQSGQAWVVVRLEDKRPMSVPSFDTVKDQIRRQMIAESMDAGAAKLVKSLVQSATIVQ